MAIKVEELTETTSIADNDYLIVTDETDVTHKAKVGLVKEIDEFATNTKVDELFSESGIPVGDGDVYKSVLDKLDELSKKVQEIESNEANITYATTEQINKVVNS